MSAVVSAVTNVVGGAIDIVGDVADSVVNVAADAVDTVADTVSGVVEGALDDPIGTMASVAAAATGQYYLLPAISAGKVVANGGDLDDALKSAAITYVAGQAGGMAGDQVSTAAQYGTELGSQQTAMLAAQNAGMGMGNVLGGAAGAAVGAGTGALLSGGDVGQAILSGLSGYGARLGMNLATNAVGQVVNQAGDVIADSYDELQSMMGEEYGDQPGDFPLNAEELAAADLELGGIPSYNMVGDQPGDYPTTWKDLALEDELMGQTGDQPGDYDTEGSYGNPLAEGVSDAAQNLLDNNALIASGGVPLDYADQPGDYDTTAEEHAASEEALANIPGSQSSDPDLVKAMKDYATNQFKNQLINNLMRGSPNYATTNGGKRVITNTALGGLGGLAGLGLDYGFTGLTSDDTEGAFGISAPRTSVSEEDAQLFNPLSGMSWAPQSKIGGLGAAGKYVNQEQDTYFINPEQAKKDQNYYNQGWIAEGENQLRPEDSLYFDYDENSLIPYDDIQMAAEGGLIEHNPQFFSEGGASMANLYVKGEGDGTSDSVPAMLASGEFVIPADVVSSLGNGDNDAGALTLDEFLKVIRQHKRSAHPSELPEDSKGPLAYLEQALTKARK